MEINHHFRSNFAVQAYGSTLELWDTPIFESSSFVALPTVGALIAGWILIVPKKPVLSMAALGGQLFIELQNFLDEVVTILEEHYGPVAMFEHGPSITASAVGCGVDYAHLHLVPTSIDLISGARMITDNIEWNEVTGLISLHQHDLQNGYWYVQQRYRNAKAYIGACGDNKPIDQLFRRVVANALNIPDSYDWKHSLGHDLLIETVSTLGLRMPSA